MIGRVLGKRYEIKEKLGSGGMSVVYKGLDTALNRAVTIKILREQYASDDDFVRRFRREAQSVASLSHINIVSIFDVGFEDDVHYLVMEYVDGQNLKEYIRDKGKLPVPEAVAIVMQILDGLEHAHEHGVIHRDIKPHNILYTRDKRVKVTDFGIARAASEATVTYTGTIVGSVHYISPEQAKGSVIGHKADIYAAGVVLYELLTGQLPFSGDSPITIALQHIQNEPTPVNQINEAVPTELEHIVAKAMQKNPDHRYETAYEMREDLAAFRTGLSVRPVIPETKEPDLEQTIVMPEVTSAIEDIKNKRKMKRRWRWALWAAVLIVLFGLSWGIYSALAEFLVVAETTVPQVEGLPIQQAKFALGEAGLTYSIEYKPHNTVKQNVVISQSVPGGRTVKRNRSINLLESEGPRLVTVPNIKERSRREAEVELNNARLNGSFSEDFNPDVPSGTVVSQQPEGGAQVPEGTTVSVVISLGPEPRYITMPQITNITFEDAKRLLEEKGLKVGKVAQRESTEHFAWYVISQGVEPGTSLLQGATVDLVVSDGPGPMARVARVSYAIPNDGNEHRLQILVTDRKGAHQEYDRLHQPGDLVVEDIAFYGSGRVQVILDGKVVYSQDVP